MYVLFVLQINFDKESKFIELRLDGQKFEESLRKVEFEYKELQMDARV